MKAKVMMVWLMSLSMSSALMAAGNPPDDPNDPCSPSWSGPPPIVPCDLKAKNPRGMGHQPTTVRPALGRHQGMDRPARADGRKLYPAPDGKRDYCTRPWGKTETGAPFCPGDIVE